MLAEFLLLYDIHRWLRFVTWIGLLAIALCLLFIGGGFPPHIWLLFFHDLFGLVIHTQTLLSQILDHFIWAMVWSGLWFVWGLTCWLIGSHHVRRARQEAQTQLQDLSWHPSAPQVSLAVSTPSASMPVAVQGGWTVGVPRLSLPQRDPRGSGRSDDTGLMRSHSAEMATTVIDRSAPSMATAPLPARVVTSQVKEDVGIIQFLVGVGWNAGLLRRHTPNEDSVAALQGTYTYQGRLLPFGLFVVADGMGGHDDGQEASRLAIQAMTHTVLQNIVMGSELSDAFFSDMLTGGVEWANLAVLQRARANGNDMGTTLTAALIIYKKAYIVNVGDSRTYLFRESAGLIQITQDHSVVASLVAFGQITPDEVYTHPERHKVYRSVGQQDPLKVDLFTIDVQPHDCLLLCSDGLWEMVRDPAIERVIRSSDDPSIVSDRLVQAALRGGGADNVSAIVVRVPA